MGLLVSCVGAAIGLWLPQHPQQDEDRSRIRLSAGIPARCREGMYASSEGRIMLVLSRKVGERILVGDQIRITVVRLTNGGVRLGIEAPADMSVLREEVKRKDSKTSGSNRSQGAPSTRRPVSIRRTPR